MHVASIHEVGPSKIRRFHCSECEKAFKCLADLNTHSVTHTKLKAFSCDVCGNKFARSNGLAEHMNIHKETYKCEACGKCFGRLRYLQAHRKACQVRCVFSVFVSLAFYLALSFLISLPL